jgi:hypothetical protein
MCVAVQVPLAPVFVQFPDADSGVANVPVMEAPVVADKLALPFAAIVPVTAKDGA